jgi:hypothetical protein
MRNHPIELYRSAGLVGIRITTNSAFWVIESMASARRTNSSIGARAASAIDRKSSFRELSEDLLNAPNASRIAVRPGRNDGVDWLRVVGGKRHPETPFNGGTPKPAQ